MKKRSRFIARLFTLVLFAIMANAATAQLSKIENQVPRGVPLKIEFKGYDSNNWIRDLEIVVTNTGKKPIYFLFLSFTLDVKAEDGNVLGFPLLFGNGDLYSTDSEASFGDDSIPPYRK